MKVLLHLRMLALLVAGLMVVCPRVGAQNFEFSVANSSSSILVSNALTYTINVTNLTGGTFPVNVTNTFPATAQLLGASFTLNTGTIATNANSFSFTVLLASLAPSQMTVSAAPTQAGLFTNVVTMFVLGVTNFTTNVVVQVTNAVVPQADLGVAIVGPAQAVITNDWMTYDVIATSAGPSAAANVVLTNTRPPGVILRGVSPTNYSIAGSNLIFNLGTLTNGAYTNLQFTIQPTNVGTLLLSASIGSAVLDTNLANNSASTNITVTNYLSGPLEAVTDSPQTYDMQNNLVEQDVLLTNQLTNDVPAVRVVVSGLAATNVLFNAVGTNNGNPFVVYGSSLAAGQSTELLLQYAANDYFPFTNSQLQAFAVPPPNLAAPLLMGTVNTNLNIISIVRLSSGRMLIWFSSVSNQTYTVAYSSDLSSTNWLMAQPSVVAPTTFTEWIDYGPPATLSPPTNTPMRFYRVFQNQ